MRESENGGGGHSTRSTGSTGGHLQLLFITEIGALGTRIGASFRTGTGVHTALVRVKVLRLALILGAPPTVLRGIVKIELFSALTVTLREKRSYP